MLHLLDRANLECWLGWQSSFKAQAEVNAPKATPVTNHARQLDWVLRLSADVRVHSQVERSLPTTPR